MRGCDSHPGLPNALPGWWNGIHEGLKILWPYGLASSNLALGTKSMDKKIIILLLVVILAALGGAGAFFLFRQSRQNIPHQPLPTPIENSSQEEIFDPYNLSWQQVSTTSVPWGVRDSHNLIVFKNKLWLIGGLDATKVTTNNNPAYESADYFNDIWSSEDGINWKLEKEHADFPPMRSVSIIEYKGALYMVGGWGSDVGYRNGIWKSEDGINWKQIKKNPNFPRREGQKLVLFNGKVWQFGGVNYAGRQTFNDVWYTEDFFNWELATSNAPWAQRWDHDVAELNGVLYLVGGMGFKNTGFDDVWKSEDGINWTLAKSKAPFGKKQGHNLIFYRNYLWLVGGMDAITGEDSGNTWFTKDGVDWQKIREEGLWSGREDHSVAVFKDKIITTGGMSADFKWHNDIWISILKK